MTTTINAATSAGGGLINSADASGILQLQTAGTAALTIDGSQNVGIGTTSPSTRLEVYNATWGKLKLNGGTGGELLLSSAGTDVGDVYASSSSMYVTTLTSIPLIFGTSNTERARIDSSGNVGIGTSSTGNYRLYVEQAGTSVDQGIAVGASANDSMLRLFHTGSVAGLAPSYDSTGSYVPLVFYSGGQERARIDTSGNVLVGKSVATFSTAGTRIYPQGIIEVTADGDGPLVLNRLTSDGYVARFYRSGTNVGRIDVTTTATSYVTSSDYRLKDNPQPMVGALEKVAQLKPCTYTWKVNGSNGQGFIAHELAEVVPDCVTGEKDAVDAEGNPVYQGIDTSFLVATLTAAIQEQQAIITTLTERISALEAK